MGDGILLQNDPQNGTTRGDGIPSILLGCRYNAIHEFRSSIDIVLVGGEHALILEYGNNKIQGKGIQSVCVNNRSCRLDGHDRTGKWQ